MNPNARPSSGKEQVAGNSAAAASDRRRTTDSEKAVLQDFVDSHPAYHYPTDAEYVVLEQKLGRSWTRDRMRGWLATRHNKTWGSRAEFDASLSRAHDLAAASTATEGNDYDGNPSMSPAPMVDHASNNHSFGVLIATAPQPMPPYTTFRQPGPNASGFPSRTNGHPLDIHAQIPLMSDALVQMQRRLDQMQNLLDQTQHRLAATEAELYRLQDHVAVRQNHNVTQHNRYATLTARIEDLEAQLATQGQS